MNLYPVLEYWEDIFAETFKNDTSDYLKMSVIKKFPFQEDPTVKAPYLLLGVDERQRDKAGIVVPDEPIEIGGSAWWKIHLHIRAAPKLVTKADKAYYLVDLLTQRVVYKLREKSFGVALGQGNLALMNRDWHFITGISPKVYGGEQQWLSYVDIYFYQRVYELGPFPYGDYPDDLEYAT